MGYNINTFSVAEDFVLIEDMGRQAHTTADGHAFEYGSTYKLLHAISHEKPIVACTLVDADYYHALPQMARLSMAEAAANDASWLLWPAWPEKIRDASAAAILPEARFLRDNEKLLNDTEPRADVSLFLCFRRWLETDKCIVGDIAAALTRENIQYAVHSEEDFAKLIQRQNGKTPVLLLESLTVLNDKENKAVAKFQRAGGRVVTADTNDWLVKLKHEIDKPSLRLSGPPTVRAVIRDQSHRSILHLYNLNVQRISPSEEKVQPGENIKVTVRVPFKNVHSVRGLSADSNGVTLSVDARRDVNGAVVTFTIPRLEIETIFVIE